MLSIGIKAVLIKKEDEELLEFFVLFLSISLIRFDTALF